MILPIPGSNPIRAGVQLGRYIARQLAPEAPPQRPQPRPTTPRTPASHPANPNSANFRTPPQLSREVQQMEQAIRTYPNSQATPAQARRIAVEVDAASRAFGVNPRVMLAIIAHESQGFKVNAESPTGARGLGQLTGVAVQEMRRLSYDPTYDATYNDSSERQHYPDPEIRSLVERPHMQRIFQNLGDRDHRFDLKDNIWGSAFYARISMDRAEENRAGAAIVLGEDAMMGTYNGASMAERRAHSAGIADSYQHMFGQAIPETLRPTV